MNNDKECSLTKLLQEPIDEKHKDLLTFTLCTPIRQPEPPQLPPPPPPPSQPGIPLVDPYLSQLYGTYLSQTQQLSPLTPLLQLQLQKNPNPNCMPPLEPISAQSPQPQAQPAAGPAQDPQPRHGPIRRAGRTRRQTAARSLRPGKSETMMAPFPWAASRRATVRSLEDLSLMRIETVTGEVQCRRCEKQFAVGYDVAAEFLKIRAFIAAQKSSLRDRSPKEWDHPVVPDCKLCGQKASAKPVMAAKKREINWLFLLLGGFLSLCSLEQLKYFCKHTGNHRTGAKDRLLYLTYLGLCKQLDPSGPFEVFV